MCRQNILAHPCGHRGYSLITPCIFRTPTSATPSQAQPRHKGFKRYTYTSSSLCPLPGCDGPRSTGAYSPEGYESVLVNGNEVSGFLLYSSSSFIVASWESGAHPLAPESWAPPIPLSAIPSHLLPLVTSEIEARLRRNGLYGDASHHHEGFQRLRGERHWSHGLRWRVGDHADGDIWGPGEEMPAGLPSAWNGVDGFVLGKSGPTVPREVEGWVGEVLGELGYNGVES